MYATIMINPEGEFLISADSVTCIRDDNTFVMKEGDNFFCVYSQGDRLTISKNGRIFFNDTLSNPISVQCKAGDTFRVTANLTALCAIEVATSNIDEDSVGDAMLRHYFDTGNYDFISIEMYNSEIVEIARNHGFAAVNVVSTLV